MPNTKIKKLTQETIYNIYKEKYPKIVEFVKTALANGETPKTIHDFYKNKLGTKSKTALNISLVAEYLLSNSN